jgi:cytochrome P450
MKDVSALAVTDLTTVGHDERIDTLLRELSRGTRDRYDVYRELRERGPVVRSRWGVVVLRFEDCLRVLSDHDTFGQLGGDAFVKHVPGRATHPSLVLSAATMVMADEPRHARLRAPVTHDLSARCVRSLRPGIEAAAQRVLDDLERELQQSEQADLMRVVAWPFAAAVMGLLAGVDANELLALKRPLTVQLDSVALRMRRSLKEITAADQAVIEISDALGRMVAAKRAQSDGHGLITTLIRPSRPGYPELSDAEIIADLFTILGAGLFNLSGSVCISVFSLEQFPGERERLTQEPSLLDNAIQELLRFHPVIQNIYRHAKNDTVIGEFQINVGELVLVMLGAANRDPARWPEPDTLRLDRDLSGPKRHALPFGHGIHNCLGKSTTTEALRTLLPQIYERFPILHTAAAPTLRGNITGEHIATFPVTTNA